MHADCTASANFDKRDDWCCFDEGADTALKDCFGCTASAKVGASDDCCCFGAGTDTLLCGTLCRRMCCGRFVCFCLGASFLTSFLRSSSFSASLASSHFGPISFSDWCPAPWLWRRVVSQRRAGVVSASILRLTRNARFGKLQIKFPCQSLHVGPGSKAMRPLARRAAWCAHADWPCGSEIWQVKLGKTEDHRSCVSTP